MPVKALHSLTLPVKSTVFTINAGELEAIPGIFLQTVCIIIRNPFLVNHVPMEELLNI